MTDLTQAVLNRAKAGAAYAAAAEAYVAAWIELHAHDMALANRTGDHRSFGGGPAVAAAHPQFLPDVGQINADPGGRSAERCAAISQDLTG